MERPDRRKFIGSIIKMNAVTLNGICDYSDAMDKYADWIEDRNDGMVDVIDALIEQLDEIRDVLAGWEE